MRKHWGAHHKHVDTERIRYITAYVTRYTADRATRQTVPRPVVSAYKSVSLISVFFGARRRGRKPRRLGRDIYAVECERRKTRRTGRRAAGDDVWQRGRVGGSHRHQGERHHASVFFWHQCRMALAGLGRDVTGAAGGAPAPVSVEPADTRLWTGFRSPLSTLRPCLARIHAAGTSKCQHRSSRRLGRRLDAGASEPAAPPEAG